MAPSPPPPLFSSQCAGHHGSLRYAAYRALHLLLAVTAALLLCVFAPSSFTEGIVLKSSGAAPRPRPRTTSPPKPPPKSPPHKSPPKSSPPKRPPPRYPPASRKPPPAAPKSPPPAGGCTDSFGGVSVPQAFCVKLGPGINLSWTLSGKAANAIVRASTSEPYGWVGFGLSPSCGMINSQVLLGYVNGANPAQIAVRPFVAQSFIIERALATPTTAFTIGSPAVLVPDSSTVNMRFGLQLNTTGRQCVVFAKGPALTAAQFARSPVPGLQFHSGGSWLLHVNFETGVVEACSRIRGCTL